MTIREAIITSISCGPIKGIELTLNVTHLMYPEIIRGEELLSVLDEMVKECEIVEVLYILPHMDYRVKSIFFPKGTKIGSK